MLKKTIQYKDLDGNTLVEEFYFNLTKAEVAETDLVDGADSMRALLLKLTEAKENKKIMALFKDLIGSTIGQRSVDGKRFIKNAEIRDAFMQSDAYSELVMEFFQNTGSVVDFVRAVVPAELAANLPEAEDMPKTLTEALKQQPDTAPKPEMVEHLKENPPVRIEIEDAEKEKSLEEMTDDELNMMPIELLRRRVKSQKNVSKRVLAIAMQRM